MRRKAPSPYIRVNAGPGSLTLDKASGDLKPFSVVAYTGVPMQLEGYLLPVVVDLARMKIPKQEVPALLDHKTWIRLGHTKSVALGQDWKLVAAGVMSGAGPGTRQVIQESKGGFPWQASIGFDNNLKAMELVPAGAEVQVNGQTFAGPLYVARDTILKEISFVPLGADGNTYALVAAQRGGSSMYSTYEAWLIDLGWTVDDIKAMSDPEKALAQAIFDAEHGPDVVDPNAPPPVVAGAPPVVATAAAAAAVVAKPPVSAAAVPVAVPVAVPITAQAQADIQAARQTHVAELQRVEACRKKCPNPALEAMIYLNDAGKPDDAGTQKKVNLLQQAIGFGWTPEQAEQQVKLATVRASRSTAGQQGIAGGQGGVDRLSLAALDERLKRKTG